MDTDTKIRMEDPYYSTDGYLDLAIKSLAEAREKIHKARDAMDGADSMTGDRKADAMTKQLEGLEAFVRGLEDQLEITAYEIGENLMEKCRARQAKIEQDKKEFAAKLAEDLARHGLKPEGA